MWTLQLYKREVPRMEDLSARLEKLLTEAEDCDLIGKLATDLKKRALFQKLASDLRSMAREVEAVIADRRTQVPSIQN